MTRPPAPMDKSVTLRSHLCIKMYKISITPGKSLGPHPQLIPHPFSEVSAADSSTQRSIFPVSEFHINGAARRGTIWLGFFCPAFIMCLRFTQAVACITFLGLQAEFSPTKVPRRASHCPVAEQSHLGRSS